MHNHLPTQESLHEFRNVIALARAAYTGEGEINLLLQLIDFTDEHISGLRTLVNILLYELDTNKRDAREVLAWLAESAATADALPPERH